MSLRQEAGLSVSGRGKVAESCLESRKAQESACRELGSEWTRELR